MHLRAKVINITKGEQKQLKTEWDGEMLGQKKNILKHRRKKCKNQPQISEG